MSDVALLTDEATALCRAELGSFFYGVDDAGGDASTFPLPAAMFAPTFRGEGILRSDDIRKDPRCGAVGAQRVVSYVAAPVVSRTGEVIGGLFFGHREPAIFTERDERAISEPRPSDRGQSRIRVPENVRGLRVLVVDDDRDATELLAELLGGYGATPIVASSAEEAFHLLERERPDALVSDIGMPLEDGYSLIRRIRKHADPVLSAIPAMALTAFAGQEEKAKALRSGFDHHLAKPVDPNELFAVLGSMTATRRRPT